MSDAYEELSDKERLESAKCDFVRILSIAIRAKNEADGTSINRQGIIADTLLLRNILTGLTIHQVLHPSAIGELPKLSVPDFASVAVLARTILESYLAMHCMAVRSFSSDEREIRWLWWDWHEVNERIRTRDNIKSTRAKLLDKTKQELANKIRLHVAYGKIPKKLRKEFEDGEPPKKSLFESNALIAKHAGIRMEHFDVQYQFLSSVAHSQPVIVRMLSKHDPNAPEVIVSLIQALEYSAAYLAFTVRDFSELCTRAKQVLDSNFQNFVTFWATIFATEFPDD